MSNNQKPKKKVEEVFKDADVVQMPSSKKSWVLAPEAEVVVEQAIEAKSRADADFNRALYAAAKLSGVPDGANVNLRDGVWTVQEP